MENDRHFIFVSLLTLAILAFIIGEANNIALNEKEASRSVQKIVKQKSN